MPLKLVEVGLRERNAELDNVIRRRGCTPRPPAWGGNALHELVHAILGGDCSSCECECEGDPGGERTHGCCSGSDAAQKTGEARAVFIQGGREPCYRSTFGPWTAGLLMAGARLQRETRQNRRHSVIRLMDLPSNLSPRALGKPADVVCTELLPEGKGPPEIQTFLRPSHSLYKPDHLGDVSMWSTSYGYI